MKYEFKSFDKSYYNAVCEFLIEISKENRIHINWNWARWEWMFFHPDFDKSEMDKIGLWFCDNNLVGVAIYDYYFGEAFFAVKSGFEELEKEILDYMTQNLSDENGLGIAVNDNDIRTKKLLEDYGFVMNEQTENILELDLRSYDFKSELIAGISLKNIDVENDVYKHHELLWRGFDHEGKAPLDEETISKQKQMLSAPHIILELQIIAKDKGEYVAYCGLWYSNDTDYVYIEPVCTIPEYRKKGIAKSLVMEALGRAYSMGAKKAYVISDMEFYKKLGFNQSEHYTFYWYSK